jgi:outer membrane protein OmpA-like peptidoglycan-associated protein
MKMSRPRIFLSLMLLSAVLATAAHAQPPSSAAHVDPNAPCYRWPAVDFDGDGVFDRVDYCNDTPKGCTVDQWGCQHDADNDGVCDGVDRCPGTAAGMEVDEHGCASNQRAASSVQPPPAEPPREIEKPAPKPLPPAKPVSEAERQLVESGRIRLENIYFETNSAVLLPESAASLREAGEALEKFPDLRIEVEGHTDTRGTNAHNMRLSQGRAGTVRSWLLEHYRLNADNIVAKGYGEEQPETKERNDEELLRNRRVVLTVKNPEALPRGVKVENKE